MEYHCGNSSGYHSSGFGSSSAWNPSYQQHRPPIAPLPNQNQMTQPNAMVTNSVPHANQQRFPDTGASFHVTSDSQNIQQVAPLEGSDQIFTGNGQGLQICSSGSSSFQSPVNPYVSLVLHKLLHVPHITKNIISICKFAKDNFVYFEFHPSHCLVKSQANNEILIRGNVGPDGLYQFPSLKFQ